MNIRKYYEDMLKTFRAVLQAFDEGTSAADFNTRVVQILSDEVLANAFLERALENVTDALLCRFAGTVCYLFERNWVDVVHAQHQLRKAGFSTLDAVRVLSRCPMQGASMVDEDKQIIYAMLDGLLFPSDLILSKDETKIEATDVAPVPSVRLQKVRSSDLNVSEVAEVLGVRRGTVLAHIQTGKLKAYDAALPGKKENWRITPLALDEFRSGESSTSKTSKPSRQAGAKARLSHIEEFF